MVVNFDFSVIVVAIRATSVTGPSYFIDDIPDLWLQIKKNEKNENSGVKMFPDAENLQRIQK